jgi:hypothetical protein
VKLGVSGARDHLEKLASKIGRIKQMMRTVMMWLPFNIPKARIKDLATYAIIQINIRQTSALNDNVAPKVKFTGVKPDFNKECGLAFGYYVEAYSPKAESRSNDIMVPFTDPCIALYPLADRNGSRLFYSLKNKAYVQRAQWKKLPTNQLVIMQMNDVAGDQIVSTQG